MVPSLVSRTTWFLGIWTALRFTIWKDKYLPMFRENAVSFSLRVMQSKKVRLGFDCRTLKMNVILSAETSVIVYQTVQRIACSNATVKTSNPALQFVYICQNRTAVRPKLVRRYSRTCRCCDLHLPLKQRSHFTFSAICSVFLLHTSCAQRFVFHRNHLALFQFQLSLFIPALTQYLESQVV